jgi:syntaxin 5
MQLQSQLAHASMEFKDILQARTMNIKSSRDRRDQFSTLQPSSDLIPANSPLYARTPQNDQLQPEAFAIDMGDTSQQLLYADQQHMDARATAIESIESTIMELGGIFQQLTRMIAEQRDTVQRIDANVDDMHTNISGAQRELLKYYRNLTSSRATMLKVFAILLVFFFLYVVVM